MGPPPPPEGGGGEDGGGCVCVSAPIYRTVRDPRETRHANEHGRDCTRNPLQRLAGRKHRHPHTWQTHRAEHLQLDRSSLRRGPIQDTPPPKQPHAGPDPRRKQQQPQHPHPPKCQSPSVQANHTEKRPKPHAHRVHAGTSAIASCGAMQGARARQGRTPEGGSSPHLSVAIHPPL